MMTSEIAGYIIPKIQRCWVSYLYVVPLVNFTGKRVIVLLKLKFEESFPVFIRYKNFCSLRLQIYSE